MDWDSLSFALIRWIPDRCAAWLRLLGMTAQVFDNDPKAIPERDQDLER
jgi:hypothetical protein